MSECELIENANFVVIQYNVHSLIRFEERVERILFELGITQWDVLAFAETWRGERTETWKVEQGDTWFGSGGSHGQRGVGFLLNKKWSRLSFRPISDRVAVLDVQADRQQKLRIIGVYMPRSMQPDDEADAVYAGIEEELAFARRKKYNTVIAGDMNAEVGARVGNDDGTIIGLSPMSSRSHRGDTLVKWCTFHDLVLANTYRCGDRSSTWTYRNGDTMKQLDFIIIDKKLHCQVIDCSVLASLDIGSDHRPLLCKLQYTVGSGRHSRRRKARCKQWKPDDAFARNLKQNLQTYPHDAGDTSDKATFLQKAMLEAAEESKEKRRLDLESQPSGLDIA